MSSKVLNEILNRLKKLEKRIDTLEKTKVEFPKSNIPEKSSAIEKPKPSMKFNTQVKPVFQTHPTSSKKESHFLGYVGSACILLASILLIKLSIDSGWLTPIRQCILASIFAGGLVALPFFTLLKEKSYTSLLPALGITILHLTIYGAVFYHKLLDPTLGLLSVSIIGLLSLWLLTKLEEETYAVLAIFGTYLGAFFFHKSFSQLSLMGLYLIVWDIAFSLFSINLKKRLIIAVSSYLALGLVAFFGMVKEINDPDLNSKIIIIQGIQLTIFAIGTLLFSLKNKLRLTEKEAWAFFPVIIFFYGQEYYFLDQISENWATLFSIGFAVFFLSIYSLAQRKLQQKELDSGGVVYTTCSLIFAHSIFIVQMNDFARVIFSFGLTLLFGIIHKKIIDNKNFIGLIVVSGLILLYSYLTVFFGVSQVNFEFLLIFGAIFGAIFLILSNKIRGSMSNLTLSLGHAQVFVTLFRLKKLIGYFAIAPLWIAYAFGILFWAKTTKDKDMAKGAIPLILIGLGRFLILDFSELRGGQQVLSLLIMGALIFAGGYLYRKAVRD